MDPTLRSLQREEELVVALSRDPQSANPGFQSFLKSKLSELNAKKKAASSSPGTALSPISVVTRGPEMRYQPQYDDSEEISATVSVRSSSNASFTTAAELFEDASPVNIRELVGKSGMRQVDERWNSVDVSRMVPDIKIPSSHRSAGNTTRKSRPGDSSSERKLRELYEAEKARANSERLKAQEAILAMKARLLQEKERHLEDMMQVIKAHYGLNAASPGQRKAPAFFAEEIRSSVKASTEPPSRSPLASPVKATVPFIRPVMTALPAHKSDPDDMDAVYTRMISNDSEALRDEYEQNFESVLDSTEVDNFDKPPE